MAYKTVLYQGFGGGLNLSAQPDVVRPDQAIDLLNVVFSDVGAIKQRDGYAKFTTSPLTNRGDSLAAFYRTGGANQILVGAGTRVDVVNVAGGSAGSQTGLAGGPYDFERFGAPNAEVIYGGNGTDPIFKWNGTAFTLGTTLATVNGVAGKVMPKGRYLAVTGTDNRLVTAGFATTTGGPDGTISSPSHVYFSDAGLPESYTTATAGVQLRPGDGEAIQGVVAWREFVFVFKETAFWVFYGTGTLSDGSPEYLRRPVTTGIGAVSPRAIVAARDGVYFLGRNGVYRTTGGAPELVSQIIDPFFVGSGGSLDFFQSSPLDHSNITKAAMTWHRERIYLSVPTANTFNDRTFVFDPRYGWWSLYDIPAAALCSFRIGSQEELVFAYASGTNDLGRHAPTYADDAGSPITSRWRSGWFDFGIPNIKTIRSWEAWGKGQVFAGMGYDYLSPGQSDLLDFGANADLWGDGSGPDTWGDGSDSSDLWGLGLVLDVAPVWTDSRGHVFSLAFNSVSGTPWEVHRVKLNIKSTREPGIVSATPA